MGIRGLPEGQRKSERRRWTDGQADDEAGTGESGQLLSLRRKYGIRCRCGHGSRDAIQRVALEWPSYGRRRITQELRRRGWTVNWKRVYRLMREDNLLCVRKRKFVVTTDSNHGRKVYPN